MPARQLLSTAIAFALAASAQAQDDSDPRSHEKTLATVVVTAAPLAETGELPVQPAAVLAGAALEQQRAATIGQTVEQLAGVQSSYFGPGVGRPIIRGLDGARVAVLANGTALQDVSTVSVDHAVTIEPFLADQIEVLKGPATLVYGSGAIGGVVNVVDGRIARQPVDGWSGRLDIGRNTVNDATQGLARIDAGNGTLSLHADYARRDGDDFDAPGGGSIDNSAVESTSQALGVTVGGDAGYVGIALSRYDSTYGIPVAEDEDEIQRLRGTVKSLAKGGEGEVQLDMEQQRADVEGALIEPLPWLKRLTLRGARNDYQHVEIELEDDEIATTFDNDATDLRVEAVLAPFAGWTSAVGIQYANRDFAAVGEEAFVPPSRTRELGLFAVAMRQSGPWTTELGVRFDDQNARATGFDEAGHSPMSLSAGVLYDLADGWQLALNLDRAERAPQAEELYSDGPHAATASYEIGDPGLTEETANQIELGVRWRTDGIEAHASVYMNRYDDFIYLAATDEEADELPVRQWTQADADFFGAEAEVKARLAETDAGRFDLRVFADSVRGKLDAGGNLPRIAPGRFGTGLSWERGGWRAHLAGIRYAEQDRVAELETPTPGYVLVNAHLSYGFEAAAAEWELYVDGTNLGDRKARVHTSFLKEIAPLPGRGIAFGIRSWF